MAGMRIAACRPLPNRSSLRASVNHPNQPRFMPHSTHPLQSVNGSSGRFPNRKPGFHTPEGIAAQSRHGTASLVASLELARRAGRIVAPILKPFGMSTDFTEGHARVENGTLVLLAQNAVQANRIRNLERRLTRALAAEGLPIFAVVCRVLPARAGTQNSPEEPASPVRHASMSGAKALRESLTGIRDPALRATLARLADVIAPRPEEIAPESERLLEHLRMRLVEGSVALSDVLEQLPPAPDPDLIPSEAAAVSNPELAGVRERMSARLAVRLALDEQLAERRAEAARLDAKIGAVDSRAAGAVDARAFWMHEAEHLEALRQEIVEWSEAVRSFCDEIKTRTAKPAPPPPPIRMAAPPEEMRRERAAETRWEANLEDSIREVREAIVRADAAERAARDEESEED